MATIDQARARMAEAGYSAEQIAAGAAYAEEQGYSGAEEFFSLAMARILYSAADLADGARYPVEPGSLDEPEDTSHQYSVGDRIIFSSCIMPEHPPQAGYVLRLHPMDDSPMAYTVKLDDYRTIGPVFAEELKPEAAE